jgi:hypothetical protein
VVHQVISQTLRQFPDVESGFDLLYPRKFLPKDPVHPPVNPE